MEGKNKEFIPNREIEKIETVIGTNKDVNSALEELDALDEQFANLLERFGWAEGDLHVKMAWSFREALINAVFHGNYGVGKSTNKDDIVQLAKEKVSAGSIGIPPEVKVNINVGRNVVDVTIQDMGQGFDLEKVANPLDEDNLRKTSGRGILMMRDSYQTVEFSGPRNQIVHLKNTRV